MRIIALLLMLTTGAAQAADTYTTRLNLIKPSTGSPNWGLKLNNGVFDVIDSSVAAMYKPNTFVAASSQTYLAPLRATNSSFTFTGANGYITSDSSGNFSGVFASGVRATSMTATSMTAVNFLGTSAQFSTITITGQDASGNTANISSNVVVQCVKFRGDGSQQCSAASGTGSGGGGTSIGWVIDDFKAQGLITGARKNFPLSATPSSSSGIFANLDGAILLSSSGFTWNPFDNTVTMTTAPALDSSQFFFQYTNNVSSAPQAIVANATFTLSGGVTFTNHITLSSSPCAGCVLYSDASGNASWGPSVLKSTNIWSGGNALYGSTTFYGTLNGDGSMLTGIQHDPVLIGIRARTNTADATGDRNFVRQDGQVAYYYIGMPPTDVTSTNTANGSGNTDTQTTTENQTQLVAFTAGTLKNLACGGETSPFSSIGNQTFTIRKNGFPTTITCSITSSSVRSCSDITHTVNVVAGDFFTLQTSSGDARVRDGACYFQYAF